MLTTSSSSFNSRWSGHVGIVLFAYSRCFANFYWSVHFRRFAATHTHLCKKGQRSHKLHVQSFHLTSKNRGLACGNLIVHSAAHAGCRTNSSTGKLPLRPFVSIKGGEEDLATGTKHTSALMPPLPVDFATTVARLKMSCHLGISS